MAARLMPTDPQRIVRALEVLESTGRSLADWQRQPGKPVLAEDETVRLLVLPDRDRRTAQRIDARFDAMLAAGALDEVRRAAGARSLDGAADHAGARGGCAGGAPVAGKPAAARPRRDGQGRDAAIRQTAARRGSDEI